jgi:alpha-D-ribose 1-methylphosphonate 5-triphosphate synthase subunit PhnL
MNPMITVENVSKSFVLHNQGAAEISVMAGASLSVAQGECIALVGASGAGKSTLMRMIYGNYLTQSGRIMVGDLDVVTAAPRQVIQLRRTTLGYVSQFLRVVPRVSTLDVVAEPLMATGSDRASAVEPHDLLGRRAAARQYRTRFCLSLSRAIAG